ncbi:hypothetical protein [Nocardioides bizhenqiangii]|uniref:MarR family transcriptional regulator n=1 Tax=Nocardioides bizhenqiangii TaxID=3095076 RepID=A0ABZ0ZQI1_9ACTN|nr:hypothetical protein [Nocardioides sp. HM61]WQQ26606.1 hypothetical protein SHK19_21955 [Nocardioides sp. HM61]
MDTLLQDEFARAAEAAGLDRGQWHVLTRLEVGAVADDSLRESLAPFLVGNDTPDAMVDRVVGGGLVEHRANEYRLTDRGRERVDQVEEQAIDDIHSRAFESLPQEEKDRLFASLERVASNLGWKPA